jgi:endonuclease YncB( thermonuclease family)
VDTVHDGDTVNVKLDVGFDLTVYTRIRVLGINAPELSTQAGKDARDYAQTLLAPGAAVRVMSYGWDKYGGRIDGSIEYTSAGGGPSDFGTDMIAAGHAKPWDGVGPRPV